MRLVKPHEIGHTALLLEHHSDVEAGGGRGGRLDGGRRAGGRGHELHVGLNEELLARGRETSCPRRLTVDGLVLEVLLLDAHGGLGSRARPRRRVSHGQVLLSGVVQPGVVLGRDPVPYRGYGARVRGRGGQRLVAARVLTVVAPGAGVAADRV